jgi:hypothetical protein
LPSSLPAFVFTRAFPRNGLSAECSRWFCPIRARKARLLGMGRKRRGIPHEAVPTKVQLRRIPRRHECDIHSRPACT